MNRTERRSWDRYVAEAREVKSEIDLPDGTVLTVYIPTADQVNRLSKADAEADIWGQLEALLGSENLTALRAVAEDAPVTALTSLMEDVLGDLGMRDVAPVVSTGNSDTSSS
jgi:hypothetical protein